MKRGEKNADEKVPADHRKRIIMKKTGISPVFSLSFVFFLAAILSLSDATVKSESYKVVLQNIAKTFPGSYTLKIFPKKILCLTACLDVSCHGFSWDVASKECKIYPTLITYMKLIDEPKATVIKLLRKDSPVIFTEVVLYGAMTWEIASDLCAEKNGELLYVPELSDALTFGALYHIFYTSLRRVPSENGLWMDAHVVVREEDIPWSGNQPDNAAGEDCLVFRIDGYYDHLCDKDAPLFADYGICRLYGS